MLNRNNAETRQLLIHDIKQAYRTGLIAAKNTQEKIRCYFEFVARMNKAYYDTKA